MFSRALPTSLSILYLRCLYYFWLEGGVASEELLSILYLRCPPQPQLDIKTLIEKLSILYLRCAAPRRLKPGVSADATSFQFSI